MSRSQGGYVLPVLMIVPLLSGEIIRHHRDTLTRRRVGRFLPAAAGAFFAIAQAYAWQYNAARSSGSPSTIQFWERLQPTGRLVALDHPRDRRDASNPHLLPTHRPTATPRAP
jgi:hypothetical protein